MFKFLTKLWRDRGGNALVIAGAALPAIVGAAGLATDTVQFAMWKREMQRMADSAALAGAYAAAEGTTLDNCSAYSTATYATPIGYDVKKNNRVWPTLTCSASTPPTAGSYTADPRAVRVTLSVTQRLPFSGTVLATTPTITATATATRVQTGNYCLVALNNTSDPSITMGGSASANLGCGAISDSVNNTSAITSNGAAYTFKATPVASVGGMPSTINGSTDIRPYQLPEPDPFANQGYSTSIPGTVTCDTYANNSYNTNPAGQVTNSNGANVTHRIKAGCYNDFSPSGSTVYYLDAGVYYLNSTNFNPGGSVSLIGPTTGGVTFILTGTNPGSVTLNGNVTVQLHAPTSGTYKDMLFIQSSAATLNNANTFNGSSTSFFDGAFYFPKGNVTLNGSSTGQTDCAMIVSWTVTISGSSTLQNSLTRPDGTACTNNKTVPAWVVKLVE
ncbi:MAG: pilus assembly protein TadG-related protein [Pseudomonadota bacterium]